MKNLLILITLFVLNCGQVRAEIVTVVSQGVSPVTNFIFQTTSTTYTNTYSVVTNSTSGTPQLVASISIRAEETAKLLYSTEPLLVKFPTSIAGYDIDSRSATLPVFVGPGSIGVRENGTFSQFFAVQITRNDEPFVPSGSVLVPADSSGPVSALLESSTNLVSWSPALPGTYGTTSQNQYFRVRTVRQTP